MCLQTGALVSGGTPFPFPSPPIARRCRAMDSDGPAGSTAPQPARAIDAMTIEREQPRTQVSASLAMTHLQWARLQRGIHPDRRVDMEICGYAPSSDTG